MSDPDAKPVNRETPQAGARDKPVSPFKGLSYSRHVASFQTESDCPELPLDEDLLDAADFELGDLRIWVHRRQFPDESAGSESADWLCVTARYQTNKAIAWASGPIMRLSALAELSDHLKAMQDNLCGKVVFEDRYPYVKFELEIDKAGKITMKTRIAPDLNSEHTFRANIDQTYLPTAVGMLKRISARYNSV